MSNDTTETNTPPAATTVEIVAPAANMIESVTTAPQPIGGTTLDDIMAEPEAPAPAKPTLEQNLATDVRSTRNHNDPAALAIAADLKDPSASPQLAGDDAERDRVIREYRNIIEDLLDMRRRLDIAEVFTRPDEGSEHMPLWSLYQDHIHIALGLRRSLL